MVAEEGTYRVGKRCYRVVKLFDECDIRREMITYETSRLYRNGEYLGNCMMKYELDPVLCSVLSSK